MLSREEYHTLDKELQEIYFRPLHDIKQNSAWLGIRLVLEHISENYTEEQKADINQHNIWKGVLEEMLPVIACMHACSSVRNPENCMLCSRIERAEKLLSGEVKC